MDAGSRRVVATLVAGTALLLFGPSRVPAQPGPSELPPSVPSSVQTQSPQLGVSQSTLAQAGSAYMALLELNEVQAELQITPEQRWKCQQVREGVFAEARRRFATLNPAERPDLAKQWEKELSHDAQASIEGLLVPGQLERLRQIRLQFQGSAALYRPDVMRALGIDGGQRESLWAVATRARQRMQEATQVLQRAMAEGRDSRTTDGVLAQMEQVRREADAQAFGILAPQQQATFQQMMGAKFEKKG
jgi:hypothetical protein